MYIKKFIPENSVFSVTPFVSIKDLSSRPALLLLLPIDICNGIQHQMNAYWWGGGSGAKRISWKVWDNMCTSKPEGGLGFRNLRQFNLASKTFGD